MQFKLLEIIDVYGMEHNIPLFQIRDLYKPSENDIEYWLTYGDTRRFTKACIDFGPMPVDTIYTPLDVNEIKNRINTMGNC